MLPDEQAACSRYLYELASAGFGWDPAVLDSVQALHLKFGQGAKTGTGGHLPGSKVTGRIADVRHLPEGTPAEAIAAHHASLAVVHLDDSPRGRHEHRGHEHQRLQRDDKRVRNAAIVC